MLRINKIAPAALLLIFVGPAVHAQTKQPTPTRNAALRYWLAFADLQDPPADKATTDLLEKTAAGEATWDEAKLGSILDKNETAIWRLQRATELPDCDWGLEYDLGPRASIAYVPKARVLSRLNTLSGMRLLANGDSQKAVDTWLAGLRFSQHLAQGGTLIFKLIAKLSLLSNFQAMTQAVQTGALTSAERKQIETAVHAIPDTGFDWGQALDLEEAAIETGIQQMKHSPNPASYYEKLMGEPAPKDFSVPTAMDISAFHKIMSRAESDLRLPLQNAAEDLEHLQASAAAVHPFFRATTPSFTRINSARLEVETARQKLLLALSAK